jgi:hypothetical protein
MSYPVQILARALTVLRGLLWFSSVLPDTRIGRIVPHTEPWLLHIFSHPYLPLNWLILCSLELLTDCLTNSMELSLSWGASSCSATQEIPSFLWNMKVNLCVQNMPSLVTALSQMTPVQQSYFSKICFNVILYCSILCTSFSIKWFHSLMCSMSF